MEKDNKIYTELNSQLHKALSENESLFEKIGRYCASRKGELLEKKSFMISLSIAATAQLAGVSSIAINSQAQSTNSFFVYCMAISGATIISYMSQHFAAKMIDPIINGVNYDRLKPEKVAKIFNKIVSEGISNRKDLTDDEKSSFFAKLQYSLIDRVREQYHGSEDSPFKFSESRMYENIINNIEDPNVKFVTKIKSENKSGFEFDM